MIMDIKAVYRELEQEFNSLLKNPRFTPIHMDYYAAAITDVIKILEQKAKEESGEDDNE